MWYLLDEVLFSIESLQRTPRASPWDYAWAVFTDRRCTTASKLMVGIAKALQHILTAVQQSHLEEVAGEHDPQHDVEEEGRKCI